jgi:hypothetical protein
MQDFVTLYEIIVNDTPTIFYEKTKAVDYAYTLARKTKKDVIKDKDGNYLDLDIIVKEIIHDNSKPFKTEKCHMIF